MRYLTKLFSIIFVLVFLTGCDSDDPPVIIVETKSPAEQLIIDSDGVTLPEFYQIVTKSIALRDPESIVYYGEMELYEFSDYALTEISPTYRQQTQEIIETALLLLKDFDVDALNESEQISYDVFSWNLSNKLANMAFQNEKFMAGEAVSSYYFMFELPLITNTDAETFIRVYSELKNKVTQLLENLKTAQAAGVIEPALSLTYKLDAINYFANSNQDELPLYDHFKQSVENIEQMDSAMRSNLQTQFDQITSEEITPAFKQLSALVTYLLSQAPQNIGVGQFPNGAAYYQRLLAHHTSTELSAEEIHQLGIQELERVHQQIKQAFSTLGYPSNESLQQGFERVAIDGGTVSAEDALATYQYYVDLARSNSPQFFNEMPTTELEIINGGGGYYPAPVDGSAPGYYGAPIYETQPFYLIPTLTYHESFPGHHYQISMAQEADLPTFRRQLIFTGYVEGWGLYAERLAYEQGWYDNDVYGNIGRLQFEAMRAARLVVDTGIHAKGWTFDEALNYYAEATGYTHEESEWHIYRYAVNVGQATAYMIGMLEMLELRQKVMDAKGNTFDLADFHHLVISNGAMPLATLEKVIDFYLAEKVGKLLDY